MYLSFSQTIHPSVPRNATRWLTTFGLSALCTACPTAQPACGDALVDATEECDDGNAFAGDGCDAQCLLEDGYACEGGQPCTATPVCGDGVLTSAEECDDGGLNGMGYNQCSPTCTIGPHCGDGVVDPEFEECDDGSNVGGGTGSCSPGCVRR